jgi:DNA-directed RNA polymerase beta' subunit
MTRIAFDYVVESIKGKFATSVAEGGEMVGPLAATSIGEISTQMTLNSVTYDTELLIKVNGEIKIVKIGDFVEHYIEKRTMKKEFHPNDTTLGWINPEDDVQIPSVDENGNCDWDVIEAVTRHPVINKDGSNTIVHVTLEDGREINATLGESFLLVNKDNKIAKANGRDLKVGDMIPISNKKYNMPAKSHFDVEIVCPKDKFCYGTEMHKAWQSRQQHIADSDTTWWKARKGVDFIVPYNREDAYIRAFTKSKNKALYVPGIILPDKVGPFTKSTIPDAIPYDFDFGYLIGAYLAEGCTNPAETQTLISNNEPTYFIPINRLMTLWNIRTFYDVQHDKNFQGWTSSTLKLFSSMLTRIITPLCGRGSSNKVIHQELFNGGIEFHRGLLSGYFAGDGCVNKNAVNVTAHSTSHILLRQLQSILLFWFGINSRIKQVKQQLTNNRGSTNILPAWTMYINASNSIEFAHEIPMYIQYKQDRLDEYKIYIPSHRQDYIPYYNALGKYSVLDRSKHNTTKELYPDISFKKIAGISYIANPSSYMYDVTTVSTRNFVLAHGSALVDTFHFSGIGEKSSITSGVHRLHELLGNRKNPKNPSCRIYMTGDYRHDKDKCNKIRKNLELTRIRDILISNAIYLEPNNDPRNILAEDRGILDIYKIFSELNPLALQIPNNPWVIRLEFDQHKILEQGITMEDINYIMMYNYPDAFMMYHDNNAAKLIFRMRMNIEKRTSDDDLQYLKARMGEIEDIVIKGVDDITKVWPPTETSIYVRTSGGVYEEQKEYYLDTDGSNLFDLLIREGVDATRTFSADPNDMLSIFGIEAAKFMIENQLRVLLENNSAKTSQRHLALLCNRMCQRGNIMQVDRHGINKENIGPLAKCSFEETSVQLQEASIFGVTDDIKGVSSNIMMGQIPLCGTGETRLLIDEEMLEKHHARDQQDAAISAEDQVDYDAFMRKDPECAAATNIKFSMKNVESDNIDYDALMAFQLPPD